MCDRFVIKDGELIKCKHRFGDSVIRVPEGVTKIGKGAFSECKYSKSIILPEGLKEIDDFAFDSGFRLLEDRVGDVVLGTSVVHHPLYSGRMSLESINLPDSLEVIGEGAFYDCKNLNSINIHKGIKSIGKNAFHGCDLLANNDGLVIVNDVLYYCTRSIGTIRIPDSVTAIDKRAFQKARDLDIIIPSSVTIRDGALSGGGIKRVKLIGDFTRIEPGIFCNCEDLLTFDIPDSVTEIGASAFEGCEMLSKIKLPSGLKKIGARAFCGSGITSIDIPYGVEVIGDSAFRNCDRLRDIMIPSSVTSVGKKIFHWCRNINRINTAIGLEREIVGDAVINEIVVDDLRMLQGIYKPCAMVPFANDKVDVDTIRWKTHMAYLKNNVSKVIDKAVANPALLDLMINYKLLKREHINKCFEDIKNLNEGDNLAIKFKLMDYEANVLDGDDSLARIMKELIEFE